MKAIVVPSRTGATRAPNAIPPVPECGRYLVACALSRRTNGRAKRPDDGRRCVSLRARTALRLPRSFSTFKRARGARANVDRRDRRRVRGPVASRTQNASKLRAGERNGKRNARRAQARRTRRRRRNRTRVSPRARRRAPSRHGSRSRAWTSRLRACRIDAASRLATSHTIGAPWVEDARPSNSVAST